MRLRKRLRRFQVKRLLVFQKASRDKIRRLVSIMLPIVVTQLAIMGMNFFDVSMAGQAGNADLAGVAVSGNLWVPVQTGISGVLLAAMPLVANFLGAGAKEGIKQVMRQGLILALFFTVVVLLALWLYVPGLIAAMGLEAEVCRVAVGYMGGVGLGVLPFFLMTPLRSLVDTLGYTRLTMKIYLLALPVNALLNYALIFGRLGLPRLGGVGAGVATGLTCWILFLLFAFVVARLEPFKSYQVFTPARPSFKWLREYLRLGLPMGCAIVMETGIMCVVAVLIAPFGTEALAAHQAAMNFAGLIYMIPLSFSMALTIVVGIEYGAQNYAGAKAYARLGVQLSVLLAFTYMLLEISFREQIARIYSEDAAVVAMIKSFLVYAICWQAGDTVGVPLQGILRGYKDVKATFWTGMLAYWGVCLPVGLALDRLAGNGPFSYWQSFIAGVAVTAVVLSLRLRFLEQKLRGNLI